MNATKIKTIFSRNGLLMAVMAIVSVGLLADNAFAQGTFNEEPIGAAVNNLINMLEGQLGALLMVVAGLGAIFAAAMGAYRLAVSLIVVAVGAFILRSLVTLFFDVTPQDGFAKRTGDTYNVGASNAGVFGPNN